MHCFKMRGRIVTGWSIFKQAPVGGLAIAEQAGFSSYLHKKTGRRHGPLSPSALTLKGITEGPLP